VWSQPQATAPVLDNQTAFLTLDLMRSVLEGGTGWRVREAGFWGPAAGKTGTTQDGADLWFAGFTPTRAATMWFGFDRRRPILAGATAEDVAAPVWGRVMRRIAPDQRANWSPPRGLRRVDVDWDGLVLDDDCASSGTVYSAWVRTTDALPAAECFYPRSPFVSPTDRRISIPRGPLRVVKRGGGH
jgi:membrane carboxypeptidase/penicillin-binding protein